MYFDRSSSSSTLANRSRTYKAVIGTSDPRSPGASKLSSSSSRSMMVCSRRALDDRQQIALHALARHVGAALPAAGARAGDLVDLVEEHDARVLGAVHRLDGDLVHVDQLARLLGGEQLDGLRDLDLAPLGL